jgi:hypothetical protein
MVSSGCCMTASASRFFESRYLYTRAPIVSAYILRSCTTNDSNNRPKVVIFLKIPSGVIPSAAAPIEGSVKCLVSFVLIAVRLLRFGFHAGSSSITYRLRSAFKYFANTSVVYWQICDLSRGNKKSPSRPDLLVSSDPDGHS